MKKLYFISEDKNKKFEYFITKKENRFILSILLFSKSTIEKTPEYHMEFISPIEDVSENAVIQKAEKCMQAILKDVKYTKVDNFGEIENLISKIIEKTSDINNDLPK